MNFSDVGNLLSQRAKLLSREYDERHDAKTVSQIKQFTSKLKRLQDEQVSLKLHTDVAAEITKTTRDPAFLPMIYCEQTCVAGSDADKPDEYIEDCICREEPLPKVLRLCCLHSVTANGLKPKVLEHYRREIVQTYGFEHVLTLDNLERAGLLRLHDPKLNYTAVRKAFNLVVEEAEAAGDITYTYSGYAPLSVRVAQALARPGGAGSEEALRLLPGPHFERRQELPSGVAAKSAEQGQRPATLVFFLGGCTFAEVSALRFLSQKEGGCGARFNFICLLLSLSHDGRPPPFFFFFFPAIGRDYVVATTSTITGASLLSSLSLPLGAGA
jgi:hypothetical protein